MKKSYVKPQSLIVWLHAPTVLVGTSNVTEGPSGTWESLKFGDSFNFRQGLEDQML